MLQTGMQLSKLDIDSNKDIEQKEDWSEFHGSLQSIQ